MKKRIISTILAAMLIMGSINAVNAQTRIPAFPGAEGGGMFASGGRGGYSRGVVDLKAGEVVYVAVGGQEVM